MKSETTQPSLLSEVRDLDNAAAWRRFDAKYRDLIVRYCRGRGLQQSDAEDVRQIVMLSLCRTLPGFQYSPGKGRFRHYLGTVVRNAISHQVRRPMVSVRPLDTVVLATVAAGTGSAEDDCWEREWVAHHYRLAMRTVRATHDLRSVDVFDRLLAGDSVEDVAGAFGMTSQAVRKVKQRVRERLTELITAQIEQEDSPDDLLQA